MALTPTRSKRLHTRIDAELLAIAQREADQRRVSLRAIVEASLRERYDPVQAQRQDAAVLQKLRALRRDVHRVEFGNRVMTELTTLTTKNLFARLPSPTAASKSAGEGFYNALIASVERVLSQQTPLLDKLAASLLTVADPEFSALAGRFRPSLAQSMKFAASRRLFASRRRHAAE